MNRSLTRKIETNIDNISRVSFKSLKKDLYIAEAVEILKDLSNQISAGKPIAQLKEK